MLQQLLIDVVVVRLRVRVVVRAFPAASVAAGAPAAWAPVAPAAHGAPARAPGTAARAAGAAVAPVVGGHLDW